jgi:glycosyltransferase involved in cell wall biosynthesis
MKNESIIFFSSDDWGWKTSKYQLSTRFAQNNCVLFVSSIGFRSPKVSSNDLKRMLSKLGSFFKGLRRIEKNLYVLTPIVIPFHSFPFKTVLNRYLLRLQIVWAKKKLKMDLPYYFVFSENWFPYIQCMKRKKLIYYIVDEQASFNGIDGQDFVHWDQQLNQMADVIFCSARMLYEKNKKTNTNTHYMPHGVNYSLFSSALDPSLAIASEIQKISSPIFLFFGHISYEWVDADLVRYLAKKRPDYSWVYIGRYSMSASEFSDYSNIYLLGEKEFTDLPSFCKGADCGIIPFVDSSLTHHCNPLKLPEYLAAGLPVISTNIPEVKKNNYANSYVAESFDAFIEQCDVILEQKKDFSSENCSNNMKVHAWGSRIQVIFDRIQQKT